MEDGGGLIFLPPRRCGSAIGREELKPMERDGSLAESDQSDSVNRLIAHGATPAVLYFTGDWLEVDGAFELGRARNVT